MKERKLNGRWHLKVDENVNIFVDKVFKKGYVTGFKYRKSGKEEIVSPLKITHDELTRDFERG